MDLNLKGRRALVTGGSRGIGYGGDRRHRRRFQRAACPDQRVVNGSGIAHQAERKERRQVSRRAREIALHREIAMG
jgi:hypothetical protein